MTRIVAVFIVGVLFATSVAFSQTAQTRLFIEPTNDGFEVFLAAAMSKKKVPVTVVTSTESATLTLKASAVEEEVVSTGSKVVNCLFLYCAGNENKASTSVQVTDRDGVVVWSYSVNKGRGSKNKQSMAEAIAKHLNDEYLKKRKE